MESNVHLFVYLQWRRALCQGQGRLLSPSDVMVSQQGSQLLLGRGVAIPEHVACPQEKLDLLNRYTGLFGLGIQLEVTYAR
jgi:hypothetical protein